MRAVSLNSKSTRLKYLATLTMGQSPPSELVNLFDEHNGIPFLQGNAEFGDKYPTPKHSCSVPAKIAKKGDLLISVRAPVGALNIADQDYGIGRGLCAISWRYIDSKFGWWAMHHYKNQLNIVSKGSTYDAVAAENVGDIIIDVPELSCQRRIADFLDRETARIDALVAEKEKMIALLQEKRSALITRAVTKGLDPDVKMKNTGIEWLGEIPEHWEVIKLKYLGEAIIGLTFGPNELTNSDNGILVLRASNIRDHKIVYEDNIYVDMEIPKNLLTKKGDILICSRSGSRALIGKNAIIDENAVGITFGVFMTVYRSKYNEYLFWVFNSPLFEYQSGAFGTTTINQLTVHTLSNMEVPFPPKDEQGAISEHLKQETARIDAIISEIKKSINLLKERRSALITAAITGKIDVEEAV